MTAQDDRRAAEELVKSIPLEFGLEERLIARDAIFATLQKAREKERERCAKVNEAWLNRSELLLHCGEMTAQELRTVTAVLKARAAAIRALPQEDGETTLT